MTSKSYVWSAVMTTILMTLAASRVALAVDEVEPNDPYTQPQALVVGADGTVTVNGAIDNSTHRDTDFYSFYGKAGDIVTVDIDGGMDANFVGVWTALGLFGPQVGATPLPSNTPPLSSVYLATSLDPGSVSYQDARIDNYVLPADGTYIVGVSSMWGYFVDINTLFSTNLDANSAGTYTLIISGVTPLAAPAPAPAPVLDVQPISIDIRPGKRDVIWIRSAKRHDSRHGHDADRRRELAHSMRGHFKGGLPVALLSSATFNAMDVDQSSLRFGSTGDEDSLVRCNPRGVDVNHDGRPDLICHFDVSKANFEPGDTEGVLTGTTEESHTAFEGKGFLKVVSGKRDMHRDHDRDDDRDGRRHRR